MFGSAVAFATMSACAHALKDRCDWRIVTIARAGLAFTLTFTIAKLQQAPLVWPGPKTLWVRSIAGSLGMLCAFFTLTHMPISGSMILQNSYPFWVALLSWPVLGIRPTGSTWVAVGCGFVGICLIAQAYTQPDSVYQYRTLATVLAVTASIFTSIVMFGLHKLSHLHPLAIALHFAGIATVGMLGYATMTSFRDPIDWSQAANSTSMVLLVAVGGLATLGQVLMTSAFQHGPPDRLAVIALSQSVFTLIFDILIWNHPVTYGLLTGMAMILGPGAWLVSRGRRVEKLKN